jgi:hypothetical protein
MSAQILNARSTRRIARSTGLDIIRAWGHGGYTMAFVTADHRHGLWDKKTGNWQYSAGQTVHYSSCDDLFPEGRTTR